MSEATVWFEYSRPHAGKLSARPVHPVGWLMLLGAPLPGLAAAAVVGTLFGKPWGIAAAFVGLAATLTLLFRLVVQRGRQVN